MWNKMAREYRQFLDNNKSFISGNAYAIAETYICGLSDTRRSPHTDAWLDLLKRYVKATQNKNTDNILRSIVSVAKERDITVPDNLDITNKIEIKQIIQKVLNDEIFGHADAKQSVVGSIMAYLDIGGNNVANTISLIGPPGVGKTALAEITARLLCKKYTKIGIDSSDIQALTGTKLSLQGAHASTVTTAIADAEGTFISIILDEVEKATSAVAANAVAAYLDHKATGITDEYLMTDIYLKNTFTIATLNNTDTLQDHIRTRLGTTIQLHAYDKQDMINVLRHKVRKLCRGCHSARTITKEVLEYIVDISTKHEKSSFRNVQTTLNKLWTHIKDKDITECNEIIHVNLASRGYHAFCVRENTEVFATIQVQDAKSKVENSNILLEFEHSSRIWELFIHEQHFYLTNKSLLAYYGSVSIINKLYIEKADEAENCNYWDPAHKHKLGHITDLGKISPDADWETTKWELKFLDCPGWKICDKTKDKSLIHALLPINKKEYHMAAKNSQIVQDR